MSNRTSFDLWVAMTGDDMPAYMASTPAIICRSWRGQQWEVEVSAEDIANAERIEARQRQDAEVPNATAAANMAAVLRGNVASQRVSIAANINFDELAMVAIMHIHEHALRHLESCLACSEGSRSAFNQGVTRGLEIATAQIKHGHYLTNRSIHDHA